jgi:uncharacterized SAM-binding protein YcdF (DUF218 family)
MDLLLIISKIWKRKSLTLPVIVLTILGLFYELEIKPPVYQASADILLVSPPGTTGINIDNPFVNNTDDYTTDLANVLVSLVSSASSQQTLVRSGVDPRSQVSQTSDTSALPIIQITGFGSSAQKAILSASLIAGAIKGDLASMQEARHVPNRDVITADEVVPPTTAVSSLSSKLRTMIAIIGLGALLLLVVVSIGEGRERRSEEKRRHRRHSDDTYALGASPGNGRADRMAYDLAAESPAYWQAPRQDAAVRDPYRARADISSDWQPTPRLRRDGDVQDRVR